MGTGRDQEIVVMADIGGADFHVGDEAMLEANLDLLREARPGVCLRVLGRETSHDAITEAVARATGVLLSGGGNLSESWPALVEQRLTLLETAGRYEKTVVVTGQTIGPRLTADHRRRLSLVLRAAAFVGVREQPSRALALELGVPPQRLVLQVDDAFTLPATVPSDPSLLAATEAPFLAVTLDGSYATAEASRGLRGLATQLAAVATELALGVVFVPHLGPAGERAGEDADVGRTLAALLGLLGVPCHLAPVLRPREAAWLSRRAALTVSSRYHPLVFATAAARPCVGLYRDRYTQTKLQGALEHVGAEAWTLETKAAEQGGLLGTIQRLWANRGVVTERMTGAATAISVRERARADVIVHLLGLSNQPAGRDPAAARELTLPRPTTSSVELMPSADEPAHQDQLPAPLAAVSASLTSPPPRSQVSSGLTEAQWDQFSRDGFLHLGQVLDSDAIARLTTRADDLAMARVHNEHVQMQLDTGGAYDELPEAVDSFTEGTRMYRKIQGLEMDDQFISLIRHPRFFEVCERMYGPHVPVSIFRAMIMNKPAGQGTVLPWHQDGGDVWQLDREPLVTIWVALDPATTANGCMEAVRGSHRLGLLSNYGSTLSDADAATFCPPELVTPLEVPAGHAVLMHNWLIHRSGVNPSPTPRRAVTICYLDGRTRSVQTGELLPVVAGTVDPAPHPHVAHLRDETDALRESAERSAEYALSLAAALEQTRLSHSEAERYAKSLEAERDRLYAELHPA